MECGDEFYIWCKLYIDGRLNTTGFLDEIIGDKDCLVKVKFIEYRTITNTVFLLVERIDKKYPFRAFINKNRIVSDEEYRRFNIELISDKFGF